MSTLSPGQWQEISPYLDHVLSLPEEEREGWLLSFSSEKPELAAVLRQLLEEHRALADEHFLERMPARVANGISMLDEKIGPYRLISLIGQGGMGTVWLAERSDGRFQRRVALKFLRFAMAPGVVAERFRREGKILGQLTHPHIAELIDAGVTQSGEPYLVLEYVKGRQIDEYCDDRQLDVDARIKLFLDVLDAVAHAHANLIVHRDIKPSNVLVNEQGEAKLLDFGIAKLLVDDAGRAAATQQLTLEGGGPLTPQCAAPEQLIGGVVTTATDVYSLGLLLYLLLTGEHPAGPGTPSPAELVKAIVEIEPRRLSDAVGSGGQPGLRDATAEKLRQSLRGDLDLIAAKALKKNPQERYASVIAFADDLRRYLNHEPVLAAPPSLTYRANKFTRRHLGAVVTVGAFALLLVVAAVISIRQSVNARKAAAEAKREAAAAQAVNDFLRNDLLAQASAVRQSGPFTKSDPDLKVRTALDRAAKRLEDKFAKEPELEASIRATIGQTYGDLGLYPEATEQLKRALELQTGVLGADHPKTLATKNLLGWTAKFQGKYPEAEALLSEVLVVRRRVLGPEHPDTLMSMNNLGVLYDEEGKYPQAEALHSQVLEVRRRVLGPEHPETLVSLSNLAEVYSAEGKYAEAKTLDIQAIEVKRRVLGAEHPETLISMSDLGGVYYREGEYPKAEALHSQVLEVRRRILGPEHNYTLRSVGDLAAVYEHEGRYGQAETLDREVLQVRRKVSGPEHPGTLAAMNDLAIVYSDEGKYAEAEMLHVQALEVRRRVLGSDHPDTLNSMQNLAVLYSDDGKYAEAEKLDRQVLEVRRRVQGPEHPDTLEAMDNLAVDYAEEREYTQAENLFTETVVAARRVEGAEHPDTLLFLSDLASMYQRKGDYALAQKCVGQSLAGRRHSLGPENPDTLAAESDLALAYLSMGKFAESEPLAHQAVDAYRRKQPDVWQRFRAETLLGESLAGQKKYSEAEPLLLDGFQGMLARKDRIGSPDRYHVHLAHRWIVQLYKVWGKPQKADEISKLSEF